MKKTIFIKILTLFSSISLVIFFILYKNGNFDDKVSDIQNLQTSPNGGTINNTKADSSKLKKDSTKKLRLSSSKVIILNDKKPTILDSLNKKLKKIKKPKRVIPENKFEIFSSSKSSAPVFTSKDINIDSLLKRTTKPKPKKKKQ